MVHFRFTFYDTPAPLVPVRVTECQSIPGIKEWLLMVGYVMMVGCWRNPGCEIEREDRRV